jgi:cis-3-alkyl-4-acyloxetan-2-one decarboxylase
MVASGFITETQTEPIYPFNSHFCRIHGLSLHYVDEGRGEPVVMVHGNPTWSFYFRHLIKDLSRDHRVIAPDHIGCGLSEKPSLDRYDFRLKQRISDFSYLMDRINPSRPVTMVVHDWGGMIAMAWAVRNVARISRIIVMNTAAFPPPKGKEIPLRLKMIRNVPLLAKPAVLWGNLFCRGALYMAPARTLPHQVQKGYLLPYQKPRHRLATLKFVQTIPLSRTDPDFHIVSDTAKRLHRLTEKPMLILWGKKDFVFDMDYFNHWRYLFPNAHFQLFESAGHYVMEDRKSEIVHEIRRFLKNDTAG